MICGAADEAIGIREIERTLKLPSTNDRRLPTVEGYRRLQADGLSKQVQMNPGVAARICLE